jgi:hypothetical protein
VYRARLTQAVVLAPAHALRARVPSLMHTVRTRVKFFRALENIDETRVSATSRKSRLTLAAARWRAISTRGRSHR